MKKKFTVPFETAERQAKASDPQHSVWVSANAGSGKTHVLAQRVIRLLLEGTDPSRILCLTYTRAAAANMSNRVFSSLSSWTMLGDDELAQRIEDLDGRKPDAEKMRRARRLFAQALETPGGLKIQTIHAFCESVLHQFPLEANIAAHFEMLDPAMEQTLFATARREMITGAAAGNPELAEAFAAVLERGGEWGLDMLLQEIVQKRDSLRILIDAAGGDPAPYEALFSEFDFTPEDSAEGIASMAWPLPGFPLEFFERFATDAEEVDARSVIKDILPDAVLAFAETDPVRRLQLLARGFLKGDGEPYATGRLFTKRLLARLPDLPQRYAEATDAIMAACDRLALFRMLEGTRAALTIADWLIARYEQLKAGRGFLDFNDLITRTVRLLARQDAGPWVQYKLDKGIDHILLDEAQDTSPDQWNVVKRLAEEFFAGFGARDNVHRTVFAVGDEKQSIYSFQGAAPESFAETGHEFSQKIRGANGSFERVGLTWSFRSTSDVLAAVDLVFASEQARRGLSHDPDPPGHKAIRDNEPGYVEVWPSVGAAAIEEPEDWREAIDHAQAPAVRVAEQVAATIQDWIRSGEIIEGTGKRLSAGDVMVLVRKRDRFVHALARSLKNRQIPVAGADRLSLPGHIAVKDMIALGRFLIQPEDDLSLAAVLRSPVFALSEDDLFALAAGRGKGLSLAASLRKHGETDIRLGLIAEKLDAWAGEAAFKPVFEFYSGVLGRDGVRRRMIARLGQEAGDILDEFLNFCLAEERAGLPGLEAFLATLESAGPDIKREMDQTRDEVRIMTVHAAKGLEAPVVFLVDGGAAPFSEQHLPRLVPFEPRGELRHVKAYLWRSSADIANGVSREAALRIRERADDEYRRLLYVGMTRAEDRLIVCGYHGKRGQNDTTWHAIVSGALGGSVHSEERPHPAGGDPVRRFRVSTGPATGFAAEAAAEKQRTVVEIPPRLFENLPPSEALPKPLSPSGASVLIDETREPVISGRSPVLDPDVEPGFAIARGIALHKLLQMLPTLPAAESNAAGRRYLERAGAGWPAGEREAALASVEAILASPRFSPLFAEGSRAEVSVMGRLKVRGKERAVSGTIDRLAITAGEVQIVDYKSNRPAPQTLDAVPPAYIVQLALYRALLALLYPGKTVTAALLFTEEPRLIELPAAVMDEALVRLTQA
ncbi:double-strand break repair helicase AddA [Allomesorhizobium camelthorni]|uniref:DNA 3'-5' helicase n=1 Tax=Allomesorhizobium camelthorni TaxID=475069 RepID=A0A6G4W8Y1_9HYPH|nr:double-strand break repair helicase AddA [Mesorhizobium camelthorni]NGO51225.1 double-strand break repair helicase AddA [Mesorhizobium camelthorni]